MKELISVMTKIRNKTRRTHIKKAICGCCGRQGVTEWHHIERDANKIKELCPLCHRNAPNVAIKKEITKQYLETLKVKLYGA